MKIGFYFKFGGANQVGGSSSFQINYLTSLLKKSESNLKYVILFHGSLPVELHLNSNVQFVSLDYKEKAKQTKRIIFFIKKLLPVAIKNIFDKTNILYDLYNKNYERYFNYDSKFNEIIKSYDTDFLVFVHPSFFPVQIPFAITVWDLGHRRHPYLPEDPRFSGILAR